MRLYERVATDLRARIAAGDYAVGQRLPAERHLANSYAVSRPTVREAVIALELDGLVEVRMGSGVYVAARVPPEGQPQQTDIGPFELLEARRAIEGEACALAAGRIAPEELAELAEQIEAMAAEDLAAAEAADRAFHATIARATQNSAMVATIAALWDARERSPQYRLLSSKAHGAGLRPQPDEHRRILDALAGGDPAAARAAMRDHLGRVLDAVLAATEVHELEQARARVAAQRRRYAAA